ncbi:MAG: radical SAM protein [Oligoflexia bacterium]|nr:radical SAM protein [Oligoflexia bacterium]
MSQYIEKRLNSTLAELEKYPQFFHIETVNSCNARCIMCGIDFDKKKKLIMTNELYSKILNDLKENCQFVKKVMPYLDGEPFLDPTISKRIKDLKDIDIPIVNIATNASLMNQKHCKEILNSGLDEIYISIDSLKPKIFEKIRKRLNFNEVMENTHHLISQRNESGHPLKIRLQIILQELNFEEKDEFIRYWKKYLKDDDEIVIQYSHNWGKKVVVKKWGDEESINQIPCIAPFGTMVIHSNGDVPLCCIDSETEYLMGDLRTNSIQDVWSSEEFKKARQAQLNGERDKFPLCIDCTLWRDHKKDIA